MILFLFAVSYIWSTFCFDQSIILKEIGEKQYHALNDRSLSSRHGECWHNAINALQKGCENLNDYEHSALALKLANCFLEDSGHITYNCHLSTIKHIRRECINQMSDRAFSAYNEFFTHATNICFFLNHEIRQIETQNTIKQLHHISFQMKEQLMEASEIQGIMLDSQREGLQIQNDLLEHGKELKTILQSSSETVNNMVTDFKESARDQKEMLFEIFSYIRALQNWIIGEVSWFQSVLYYTGSCIICALFSSSKRTIEARMILFTILSINVVLERMLVQWYENNQHHTTDDKVQLVNITWMLRKVTLSLCAIVLLVTYYCYKDEQIHNYKALQRIEHQLNMLHSSIPSCGSNTDICTRRLRSKRLQKIPCQEKK